MNKMSLIIRSTNEDILVINSSLSLLNPRNILTEQRKFGGHFFYKFIVVKEFFYSRTLCYANQGQPWFTPGKDNLDKNKNKNVENKRNRIKIFWIRKLLQDLAVSDPDLLIKR